MKNKQKTSRSAKSALKKTEIIYCALFIKQTSPLRKNSKQACSGKHINSITQVLIQVLLFQLFLLYTNQVGFESP
jgi:hypothetical protein